MEAKSMPFQAWRVVLIHVHDIYALPTVKHKKSIFNFVAQLRTDANRYCNEFKAV